MWEATALVHIAFITFEQGDLPRATACAERSLALFEAAANTWGASRALRVLARIAARQSQGARALALHKASRAFVGELADEHSRALATVAEADDLHASGETVRASQLYERGLARPKRPATHCSPPAVWKDWPRSLPSVHPSARSASPLLLMRYGRVWERAARCRAPASVRLARVGSTRTRGGWVRRRVELGAAARRPAAGRGSGQMQGSLREVEGQMNWHMSPCREILAASNHRTNRGIRGRQCSKRISCRFSTRPTTASG
jgi:hypothetical protein